MNQYSLITLFLVCTLTFSSFAQNLKTTERTIENQKKDVETLNWLPIKVIVVYETRKQKILEFNGAVYITEENLVPRYQKVVRLAQNVSSIEANLENIVEVDLTPQEIALFKNDKIEPFYKIENNIGQTRGKVFAKILVTTIRKTESGQFKKLKSFNLNHKPIATGGFKRAASNNFGTTSKLASGTWFKFGVTKDGVYKIDKSFLAKLGVDQSEINPLNVRIFGNGGKMLPIVNNSPRIDDLEEIAIELVGLNDNSFDNNDYVLFFGQSPHTWRVVSDKYRHNLNYYSDTNYYFITFDYAGSGAPKRISEINANQPFVSDISYFDHVDFYDRDLYNHIKSGRIWYGEQLGIKPTITIPFQVPNIATNIPATARLDMAVRSITYPSTVTFSVIGTNGTETKPFEAGFPGYDQNFASVNNFEISFTPNTSEINTQITLNKGVSSALGWINYIEIHAKRLLRYNNELLNIRFYSTNNEVNRFLIQNFPADGKIWKVSNHQNVISLKGTNISGNHAFTDNVNGLNQYVVFNDNNAIEPQSFIGKIVNQNLHGLSQVDMIIVSHPDFISYAEDLAEFHRIEDTLTVHVANVNQIYNEFSSGKQDITAIKDFVRMFYERANGDSTKMPRYLLLFGDASYDYKNITSGNSNYVPTYQSNNSLSPTYSYVSDDYFGLLDPDEGEDTKQFVDIGIGRFPVRTKQQAQQAVAKIKNYYKPQSFGPWRNYLSYVGDDEDTKLHMQQAETLANAVNNTHEVYNFNKIYLDAYKQESTPGGNRYPDAKEELISRVNKGALIVNYHGHGGELGWAHERLLEVADINKFSNTNNLPLFMTATCEFTRFDDPARTSAGEFVFLNPDGGGIGLLTTTRLVFSTPNMQLAQQFNKYAFIPEHGIMPRIGDINRLTKLHGPTLGVNTRSFSLIGDPAVRLAYPKLNVVIMQGPDTIKALEKVTFKGYVADKNGQVIPDFNGIVYPLVFDKEKTVATLDNDGEGVFYFKQQNDIIFRGKSTVKNGYFEFSFVVPKDIIIDYGFGKVSLYADNDIIDANGFYKGYQIGGINNTVPEDNKGPLVELFLNDESFVFGGITNSNPVLYAKLFDDNGINTVGNGIGHDIVAILDENSAKPIVLNNYYESDLDSYQSGTVQYNLSNLEEGKHTLKLKAWDVHNNSGEAFIEFYVANNEDLVLENILNYPNPFTTKTAFYFDHNQPGQSLQVRIQVFTVSGKLVKTIDGYYNSKGFRIGPIDWNGLDDFNDQIGKGVYIYKLKVTTPDGKTGERFEKLVILK